MGAKIGGIILLIVGIGIVLYFVNSGAFSKAGSALQPLITSPAATTTISGSATSTGESSTSTASSTNPFITFLTALFGFHHQVGALPTPSFSSSTDQTQQVPGSTTTLGSTPATTTPGLSPYYHEVRLGGVSASQISLYAYTNNQATTTIDITGWGIITNRGGEYIPQAVNIYDPSSAPRLSDIILTTNQNDIVNIYSSSAPISLRLNECMGYLSANTQFNPPLPNSCPQVDRSAITNFTGICQNYILSLGCQQPNMSSPQIPQSDYACQQYLENNFTYNSCISNHARDANFLSTEWRVWLGSSPLDPYHDNIKLLDKNGLLVDSYSY